MFKFFINKINSTISKIFKNFKKKFEKYLIIYNQHLDNLYYFHTKESNQMLHYCYFINKVILKADFIYSY